MDINTNNSASWENLPWRKFEVKVLNLQFRIYSAVSKGQINQAIKLQKLLVRSLSTHLIAVRRITELNVSTLDINIRKEFITKSQDKFKVALKTYNEIDTWKYGSLKQSTTLRSTSKIANIDDIIVQYVWKMALEPAQEFFLPNNLYGFRINRNQLDVQKAILLSLSQCHSTQRKKILKIILCTNFNENDYKSIMKKLIFPTKYKNGIFKALQSGILKENPFSTTSIMKKVSITPLLANVALYGITNPYSFNFDNLCNRTSQCNFNFCYGNSVLLMIKTNQDEKEIIDKIDFFKEHNIIIKRIIQLDIFEVTDGFNFLDWRFFIKNTGKVTSYPSRENWLYYKTRVKQTLKNSKHKIETRIDLLKRLSKNWNYHHRYCDMSKMKTQVYYLKKWYSFYLRSNTKIIKEERIRTLKEIFHNYRYHSLIPKKDSKNIYTSFFDRNSF